MKKIIRDKKKYSKEKDTGADNRPAGKDTFAELGVSEFRLGKPSDDSLEAKKVKVANTTKGGNDFGLDTFKSLEIRNADIADKYKAEVNKKNKDARIEKSGLNYDLGEFKEFFSFIEREATTLEKQEILEQTAGRFPRLYECFISAAEVEQQGPTIPLWAERTTGREVSPVDWVRKHYGKVHDDGTWDADGLTRADLNRFDRKLYNAYAMWIKRHPDDDLRLPTVERAKVADPEDALERRRAANRRSYHKNKLEM